MIKKSLLKIICLSIIVGLNWTGLSAVGKLGAYFSDTGDSPNNIFQVGVLDMDATFSQDFFPSSPGKSNKLIRNISVIKKGNLNFKYQMRVDISSVSGGLCDDLQLSAKLDDEDNEVECPVSDLASFSCGPFEISDSSDDWQFVASLPEGVSGGFLSKSCEFKLIFEAWQTNLPDFSSGFSDIEKIENKITKHYSEILPKPDILINEFLPDPKGPDDASKPAGEWVEIYNRGNSTTTLTGWYLSDLKGNQLAVPTSDIAPKGFLVVYLNGAFPSEWLDNSGDAVLLWAPKSANVEPSLCFRNYCLADAHFYRGAKVVEGKSFARIPDGSETWYDPDPTPGAENQLSEEEIAAELQPEVMELSQEQLFQEFINQIQEETTEELTEKEETSTTENEIISDEEMPADEEIPADGEGTVGETVDEVITGESAEATGTSRETTEDIIEDEDVIEDATEDTVEDITEETVDETSADEISTDETYE